MLFRSLAFEHQGWKASEQSQHGGSLVLETCIRGGITTLRKHLAARGSVWTTNSFERRKEMNVKTKVKAGQFLNKKEGELS